MEYSIRCENADINYSIIIDRCHCKTLLRAGPSEANERSSNRCSIVSLPSRVAISSHHPSSSARAVVQLATAKHKLLGRERAGPY
jgi:hypothetical protein